MKAIMVAFGVLLAILAQPVRAQSEQQILGGWAGPEPAPASVPAPAPAHGVQSQDVLEDCFEIPQTICMHSPGASYVMGAVHVLNDLIIWYQFDKSLPVDDSGHWHHLHDPDHQLSPLSGIGPGILGRGASAAFDGRDYGVVRSTASMETESFTFAMWLYLLEDSIGYWRVIAKKGANADELLPALLLWPDERRLQVRVSPRADVGDGVLDSKGTVPLRRWTHIAVTCAGGGVLRLYINGIKDGEVVLDTPRSLGSGELYLGRDPWHSGTKAYMDDFRWYNRDLHIGEIHALLFPSLTGMATNFVHLGCSSCPYTAAVRSCGNRAHLCSLQELFSGGFHAARAMGWLASSPEVWYLNAQGDERFSGVRKLGLCCTG